MTLKQQLISRLPGIYEVVASITGVTPKGRAQGVDIYGKYQGWFRPETATQQIDFAVQKLTEGTTIVDLKRDEIWNGVKQIGMRGAYHYQRSGVSWKAQADYFLDIASRYDHHFFALDVEKINNALNDSFWADMYRIVNYWKEQAPSKTIVLYSNKDLFGAFIYPRIKALYGGTGLTWLIDNVNIWYAQYWNEPSVDKDPALPAWMKTWRLWQITPSYFTGASFGVQSREVDVDVFNGTPDQMRAWLGITSQPPVEPDPPTIPPSPIEPEVEPVLWNAEVISNTRVYVRSYPVVGELTKAGFVYHGAKFSGRIWVGNGYVWMKIMDAAHPDISGKWVAVRSLNGTVKLITLTRADLAPSPALPQLWMHKDDLQLGGVREAAINLNGAPQVFTLLEQSVSVTRQWQYFIRAINCNMQIERVSAIFGWFRAFCNKKGLGNPDDPRADYLLSESTTSPNPQFDKVRTCARSVLAGVESQDDLMVHTLDGRQPPKLKAGRAYPQRVENINLDDYFYSPRTHPWLFFTANNVQPDGDTVPFSDDGGVYGDWMGDNRPYTFLPHVSGSTVWYPKSKLVKLPMGSAPPNPYHP